MNVKLSGFENCALFVGVMDWKCRTKKLEGDGHPAGDRVHFWGPESATSTRSPPAPRFLTRPL